MGSSRKSYAQLEAEIQALIKKRETVIEDSAEILRKAILTDGLGFAKYVP